jgi:type II secretory pathway component GspD/PulD (secretin)
MVSIQRGGGGTGVARGAVGGKGGFEASFNREVVFNDVPEGGQPITEATSTEPMAVTALLDLLSLATNWNIISSPGVETKKVRLWVNNATPRQVLEVLRFNGYYYNYEPKGKLLYVMTMEEYFARDYGGVEREEFSIHYADVLDVEAILSQLLSSQGRMLIDPRTGRIVVYDTDSNLIEMRKAVDELDVPLRPRVFQLRYANAEDLLTGMEGLLSERGNAIADPRLNTLVVTDLPARLERIEGMLASLDQQLESRTWTLNYIDPSIVEERLTNMLPDEMGDVTADDDTHQFTVTTIPERVEQVNQLIEAWDVMPKQVRIEAFIVSAGTTVMRDLGINWRYFNEVNGNPFIFSQGTTGIADLLAGAGGAGPASGSRFQLSTIPALLAAGSEYRNNLVAAINFLDVRGDLDVLAKPEVTVLDGELAIFQDTQDKPYQEGGFSQNNGSSSDNPNFNRVIPMRVTFVKVGIILEVTPRINDEGNIMMEVMVEDSDAEDVVIVVGDQSSTVPSKNEQKAETKVVVADGQTLVLGGLRDTSVADGNDQLPILGDVPFLGRLFKTTKTENLERELMVFITPTIVDEFTQPEARRLAEFDEEVADKVRAAKKPWWERAARRLRGKDGEITVAVGRNGNIFSEGEMVTLEDLSDAIAALEQPQRVKLIVSSHYGAPPEIADSIAALAEGASMKLERVEDAYPFVPADRPLEE